MLLISAVNRARISRMVRTFQEVHAETGSLTRSIRHMARFVGKKFVPLIRYGSFTVFRLAMSARVKRANRDVAPAIPVMGIRILGGVGDYIVIARFLRDLIAAVGPAVFDVYTNKPGLASWIFASVPGYRGSADEALFGPGNSVYTVEAQISQFILIEDRWITPETLRSHPRLRQAVAAIRRFRPSIEPIIAAHPRLDSFLAQKAIFGNRNRRDYLHLMAGIDYAGDSFDMACDDSVGVAYGLFQRPYVTVHNGYDPNMVVSHGRATKCYPHFGQVIEMLRQTYGGVLFVQVGIHTSTPIAEADLSLVDKTTMPQVASLLRGAVFHLDNEGGLVHLASAMGTRSCVVFGPTSSRYFGYPGNVNIDPGFCGGCWWITETWMNHCPRGFATARCMTEQPAAAVARAAATLLEDARLPLDVMGLAE